MSAEKQPIKGRAWVFGDNIDTDQLAPVQSYMNTDGTTVNELENRYRIASIPTDALGYIYQ